MGKRKVLLVEPNYKNKYPPMGLMKLATYFRRRGDDVRFYKGDMKAFAVEMNTALNGRGGGRDGMIQGRVSAKKEEIIEFFNKKFRRD